MSWNGFSKVLLFAGAVICFLASGAVFIYSPLEPIAKYAEDPVAAGVLATYSVTFALLMFGAGATFLSAGFMFHIWHREEEQGDRDN